MQQVAELTVPELADLCVIDLLDGDHLIRDLAVVAREPALASDLERLRRDHPIDPAGDHPVARVLRSGTPELLTHLTPELLETFAEGAEHARFMIEPPLPLGDRRASAGARPHARHTLGPAPRRRTSHTGPRTSSSCASSRAAPRSPSTTPGCTPTCGRLEQRLEAILASVAEAITVINEDGQTVYANQAAADLLGTRAPERADERDAGQHHGPLPRARRGRERARSGADAGPEAVPRRARHAAARPQHRASDRRGALAERPHRGRRPTRRPVACATPSTCSRTSPR